MNFNEGKAVTLEVSALQYFPWLIEEAKQSIDKKEIMPGRFIRVRKMKEQGNAIIIITHKLHEVLAISDRVTILRKGQLIDTVETSKTTDKQLTELMVGRPVSLKIDRPEVKVKKPQLNVSDLTVMKADGTKGINNLNFELYSGEILGVAGIAGSGQKELCESIAGLMKVKTGAVLYQNENIIGKTPDEIIHLGISMSFVPEDRLGMGLVGSMGMVGNMLLKSYKKQKGFFIDKKPARKLSEELVKKLEIVTPDIDTPVRRMSGGNVQKVLLGREIESKPNVLITAYPVRGLDINSSYMIYDLLNEQKKNGVAILFIGEDLDVLLELSDRIMVLCHGELKGIVDAKATTKEELGLMMTGRSLEGVDSDV
jgi:simple sugar transport system ATP-binding protein